MPWSQDRKQASRERILEAAARCFTQHGFDAVSIDAVMASAGMTRGAFYAHFGSKSELYACAIDHAARCGAERFSEFPTPGQRIDLYLSQSPRDSTCPLACLVSDVAHRDERVRTTYTALLNGFIGHVLQDGDDAPQARQRSLMQAVAMVGSLAIARTVNDPDLADELLAAGRRLASDVADGGAPTLRPGPAGLA